MSFEKHDDNCPGCQPVILDPMGRELPADSPHQAAVSRAWAATTRQEREAWHRFTCQNSRLPSDLRLVAVIRERIGREMLTAMGPGPGRPRTPGRPRRPPPR